MADLAIEVEGLSKRYRIGHAVRRPDNIGQAVVQAMAAPFRYLRYRISKQTEEDTIWALKDVSFQVNRGEVVGVIGQNGAGKSTLLKILSKITDPTSGRARIRGRVNSLLEVGTGFHPELTGRENVYLSAAIHGMRKAEVDKSFDEIVAFAGVERFIDTPVKRYSSGMGVRLGFAVAAHLEPEVLLVDEVLAVGDLSFQKKCLGKMGEVSREGRTVLIVSHNMPSIMNLCKRAILLRGGGVVADGAADDVVARYIASSGFGGGEASWPELESSPGNELVRLRSVRILQDGSGSPTADTDISRDIAVEMTYQCMKEGSQLYAALWLRDTAGTPILSSGNANSVSLTTDEWYGRPHPCGTYKTVCRIPGNFLNDKRYSVTAIVGKAPSETIVLEENVVSFHVHDTGEMRKEYYGDWFGVVRPRLAWRTEKEQ